MMTFLIATATYYLYDLTYYWQVPSRDTMAFRVDVEEVLCDIGLSGLDLHYLVYSGGLTSANALLVG